jgi:site-specific recombinase XerC
MRRRGNFVILSVLNEAGAITCWMVRGTKLDGERVSPTFKTEGEALLEKQRLETEAANIKLPQGRLTYVLDDAQLRDAEKAILLLKHGSLEDAVTYYEENHVPIETDKTLKEAYPLFLEEKKHLRPTTMREYNSDLKMLISAHPAQKMNDVNSDKLKTFLRSAAPIPGHPRVARPWSLSRQRYMLRVYSPFFSWGIDEGYCATNPVLKVKLKKALPTQEEPAVLALALLQQLLDVSWTYLGGRYAAYVVLTTWAALRPTETRVLDISRIDLDDEWIKMNGKAAKTRSRRMVELMPNILMMLRDLRDRGLLTSEALKPSNKDWTAMRALAGLAGCREKIPDWCFLPCEERLWSAHRAIELRAPCSKEELVDFVSDVLRHTGISHHLAWLIDENLTAAWAGNSPAIIHKHYKGLVTTLESQKFWTMLPTLLKMAGKHVSPPEGGRVRRV